MAKNDTFDNGSFQLPAGNEPLVLSIGISGAVHEASTAIMCGEKRPKPKPNSFDHEVGNADELEDDDLIVVTRITDMDPTSDTVEYRFTIRCGDKHYTYNKVKTFDAAPTKGQQVKYTTILTLYRT